jgi:hypothetical protein
MSLRTYDVRLASDNPNWQLLDSVSATHPHGRSGSRYCPEAAGVGTESDRHLPILWCLLLGRSAILSRVSRHWMSQASLWRRSSERSQLPACVVGSLRSLEDRDQLRVAGHALLGA